MDENALVARHASLSLVCKAPLQSSSDFRVLDKDSMANLMTEFFFSSACTSAYTDDTITRNSFAAISQIFNRIFLFPLNKKNK